MEHVNVNSIRNNFVYLTAITKENVDELMISKTKLDESFPSMEFINGGYNFFRSYPNPMQDDIPCRLTPMRNSTIKGFFIELKLRKSKWLLCCSCSSHR